MAARFENLFHDLSRYAARYGIRVRLEAMDIEKPGEFDGPAITINPRYAAEARSYYLAHALGSITQWSTDFRSAQKVFRDLRDAVSDRDRNPEKFTVALQAYCQFEERSSEHAVWALGDAGYAGAVGPYTIFFRADLAAMTLFHRTGRARRWREFYPEFRRLAKAGIIHIERFHPRPIPPFEPIRIDTQEVFQERG